jgi:hypothetical protein
MEDVINKIAEKFGKDARVIKLIAEHPLLFTRHIMENPDDVRPVMIRHLGKFIYKQFRSPEEKKVQTAKYLKRKSIAVNE